MKQVDKIYIIDNSDIDDLVSLKKLADPFTYYKCDGNQGMGKGLNIGYQFAIRDGFDWVLSMDQDSLIDGNLIKKYTEFINNNINERTGALMPSFRLCPNSTTIIGGYNSIVKDYMTSGSLVNLNAYEEVGGFDEKLFIDLVDTDFGIKLLLSNWKMYRIGNVVMNHNIGNAKEIRLFGHHLFYITHHNYLRRYYITRNILELKKRYSKSFPLLNNSSSKIFKSLIRIILFEKDKLRKLKSVYYGVRDFYNDKYGKYNY